MRRGRSADDLDPVGELFTPRISFGNFEADLPLEIYAYRAGRNAQQAAVEVEELLFRGHPDVVDADLADYFGSIPHSLIGIGDTSWRRPSPTTDGSVPRRLDQVKPLQETKPWSRYRGRVYPSRPPWRCSVRDLSGSDSHGDGARKRKEIPNIRERINRGQALFHSFFLQMLQPENQSVSDPG